MQEESFLSIYIHKLLRLLRISEVNPIFLFQETEVIDLDNVLKRFLKGNLGLL